jgi:hypothetical protein
MNITNEHNISLALAVWLAADNYDHNPDPYVISATTLIQPLKALVLVSQNAGIQRALDISSLIPSRMGTALHDSLEAAWKDENALNIAFETLGLSKVRDRVYINPADDADLPADAIRIYLENRSARKIGKWTITGKYDLVMDGKLADYKSTSVWTYIFGSNDSKYAEQGSIYKWLNPTKITEDKMDIHFIFTDWSGVKAKEDPKYPQIKVLTKEFFLDPPEVTESKITDKLAQLEQYMGCEDQGEIPACTPEDLWQKDPVWKYYKNPNSTARSTKNFDNEGDAIQRLNEDGGVGKIVHYPGEVVRCRYCNACDICDQAQGYLAQGILKL